MFSKTLSVGTRIEGFYVRHALFLEEEKALQHAWKLANECYNNTGRKDVCSYADDGEYTFGETGYEDWPRYKIMVERKKFDSTSDVPLQILSADDD